MDLKIQNMGKSFSRESGLMQNKDASNMNATNYNISICPAWHYFLQRRKTCHGCNSLAYGKVIKTSIRKILW
jgi:hypothetical protein